MPLRNSAFILLLGKNVAPHRLPHIVWDLAGSVLAKVLTKIGQPQPHPRSHLLGIAAANLPRSVHHHDTILILNQKYNFDNMNILAIIIITLFLAAVIFLTNGQLVVQKRL